MTITRAVAPSGAHLLQETIRETLTDGLAGRFAGRKILVLIPDHTRTVPLPALFRLLVELLGDAERLDFMVALGTHPTLSERELQQLVGITAEERNEAFAHVGLFNHAWDQPGELIQVATLSQDQVQAIAGEVWHPSLGGDVPVNINRRIFSYDHLLILGPTFPHEVVGFSGGAKYLFPGISGPEMINVSHWLGALKGVRRTIGIQDTPVRELVHAAAAHVTTPVTLIALVVVGEGLAGMFIGDLFGAWREAADLSAERHILWFDRPFQRVLSWAPPMYDELWTGAKAMYKLDPVVADGGEVVIYAPHLERVSRVHGEHIFEIGYHVLSYFLAQWERFQHIPLGVLAHSTHVRGDGSYVDGAEQARVQVTLSSRIPPEDCRRLALDYLDPARVDLEAWQGREAEGVLYVPKAGEMLYRWRPTEGAA